MHFYICIIETDNSIDIRFNYIRDFNNEFVQYIGHNYNYQNND